MVWLSYSRASKAIKATFSKRVHHKHGGALHVKMIKQIEAKFGEEKRDGR